MLGPDGRVMDGMHRVCRAILEDRPTLAAVRFTVLPEPDLRNCRIQDVTGTTRPDQPGRSSSLG
jgi:hypothetical protein